SHSGTRPISVAELLARNGTIGAPPVGGRRRRRRGNSDSVTVAELTGEIPVVSGHDVDETEKTRTIPAVVDEPAAPSTNGVVDHDEVESETVDEPEAAEADDDVDETEKTRTIPAVVDEPSAPSTNGVVDHDEVESETVDEPEAAEADVDDDYAGAVADY